MVVGDFFHQQYSTISTLPFFPQKRRWKIIFQPYMFRCKLLVSGWVMNLVCWGAMFILLNLESPVKGSHLLYSVAGWSGHSKIMVPWGSWSKFSTMTTVYHLEWFRNIYIYGYMSTWNNLFFFFLTFAETVGTKDSLNIDTSLAHISHSFTWGPTSSRITSNNNHNYYTSNICSQHVSTKNCLHLTCDYPQFPFTVIRKANWA